MEKKSEHPLAEAIVQYITNQQILFDDVESFQMFAGEGVTGIVTGVQVVVGNIAMMKKHAINTLSMEQKVTHLLDEGKTVVHVAVNGKLAGILATSDTTHPKTQEAISSIKEMGIRVVMITGDNGRSATAIARMVGIDEVIADVMPDEKAARIRALQSSNTVVAMVGDGINDAPALAQADVSIAMGHGTDIAMETADITLMRNDLRSVVHAIALSRQTMKTIRQNLFWAFIYNIVGIPLAALGLMNPMFAAAAMALSSVSVVSNSLRLRFKQL
jgi:Cu+-exporting ATPase